MEYDIVILIGLGLLIFGVVLLVKTVSFVKNSTLTKGKVVAILRSITPRETGANRYSYAPLIEFTTQAGEVVQFKSSVGHSSSKYNVGEELNIIYSESEPELARINLHFNIWWRVYIVFFLGVGLLGSGINGALGYVW